MGVWSSDAPVLPEGKTWVQEQTTQAGVQSLFHMHWRAKIVRLAGNQIGIRLDEWCTRGSTANPSWFQPPKTFNVKVIVNGKEIDTADLTTGRQDKTVTWYYTGNASSKASVVLELSDGSSGEVTISFVAPDADGNEIYINIDGVWSRAELSCNVAGVWNETLPYCNIDGEWK